MINLLTALACCLVLKLLDSTHLLLWTNYKVILRTPRIWMQNIAQNCATTHTLTKRFCSSFLNAYITSVPTCALYSDVTNAINSQHAKIEPKLELPWGIAQLSYSIYHYTLVYMFVLTCRCVWWAMTENGQCAVF